MKIAVSIPDDLFERAERLRWQERRSRSKVFAAALTEYVARHAPDEVTGAMNRVCADLNTVSDDFIHTASRRILEQSEW
jgi:metal-responsive CopG/Arc/MetJ family transcriptional regulator